jgi:pimeloyl-ACP methyl ester carboxylesterase
MMTRVDGASIHYEVSGSGPVLLLVPGGSGDAAGYAQVAPALAADYTVVAYDRRGFGRSPLDQPAADGSAGDGSAGDGRLAADVEDAVALIDLAVAEHGAVEGPAFVFGSSSGAIVALHLLVAHAGRLARVVAHEPPLVGLLPDGDEWPALLQSVHDVYVRDGQDAAMNYFGARLGMPAGALPPVDGLPPHLAELIGRLRVNQRFWFEHELRQYPVATPDLDALAAHAGKLTLAGGVESKAFMPYLPNLVIAERLGTRVVDMPGDHVGYVTRPAEFAAALRDVLA